MVKQIEIRLKMKAVNYFPREIAKEFMYESFRTARSQCSLEAGIQWQWRYELKLNDE